MNPDYAEYKEKVIQTLTTLLWQSERFDFTYKKGIRKLDPVDGFERCELNGTAKIEIFLYGMPELNNT